MLLPTGKWFTAPWGEMQSRLICTKSGLPATAACPDTASQFVPHAAQQPKPCAYHQKVFTDSLGHRVHKSCYTGAFQAQYPFVLPPTMAWFYRLKNPAYSGLPAWRYGCGSGQIQSLALIYPKPNSAVFIPRNLDGAASKVVLEAAPAQMQSRLFWHLNDQYLGSTETFHQMPVFLQAGIFNLLVQDEEGNAIREQFVVKSGDK
jgi:penicillin-binding protein 1C